MDDERIRGAPTGAGAVSADPSKTPVTLYRSDQEIFAFCVAPSSQMALAVGREILEIDPRPVLLGADSDAPSSNIARLDEYRFYLFFTDMFTFKANIIHWVNFDFPARTLNSELGVWLNSQTAGLLNHSYTRTKSAYVGFASRK